MAEAAWVTAERQSGPPVTAGTFALLRSSEARQVAASINELWSKGLHEGRRETVEVALFRAEQLLAWPY